MADLPSELLISREFSALAELEAESQDEIPFTSGDLVEHPHFGEGRVRTIDGGIVEIQFFQGGLKKLAAGVAPLTLKRRGDEIELE